jgi:AraC family chitin signaling transcriptional activator
MWCFLRCLWVFLLLPVVGNVVAHDELNPIYHPLPFQEQGLFFTAKKMFPGASGGLWLHDIHGNIRFFDGQHVLPRVGSAIDKQVDEVVFLDQAFWHVKKNWLYKSTPAGHTQRVTTLGVGTELTKIGRSGRKIWATDNQDFYVYHPDSSRVQVYSLDGLSARMYGKLEITSASFVKRSWVIGTTSGVYLTYNDQLTHAKLSGDRYVESLYYSKQRNELVVGGRNGAILIDINNQKQLKARIGKFQVRSVVESEDGYWVGTENGLYIYEFASEKVRKIGANHQDSYALSNDFIHSLVNDRQGGIWVATSQEIRYYSLSSELFHRVRLNGATDHNDIGVIHEIVTDDAGTHWIATDKGLYSYNSETDKKPVRRMYKPVYDVAFYGDSLWLALDTGVATYHIESHLMHRKQRPALLTAKGVRHITVDDDGLLWFDSEQGLIQYRIGSYSAENLGNGWFTDNKIKAITHLYADDHKRVFIGTSHGTYLYSNGRIQFLKASALLGRALDVQQAGSSDLWSVYNYGLYFSENSPYRFRPALLNEPNIRMQCVLSTKEGVWAASSKGLSFYRHNGELEKHFSAPFGLVNNEFMPDSCSYDPQKDELIFASRFGLVSARQSELAAAQLPVNKVLTSQILIDNQPYKIGFKSDRMQVFPYDSSLSFIFGVLPDFDQSCLEYKLVGNGESDWIILQGKELAFSSLFPGKYKLYVRTKAQAIRGESGSVLAFTIQNPWYLSPWALSLLAVVIITKVVLLIHWRSARVLRLNRYLQKLVKIKTCQLENQSQALMAANQRLKQELKEQSAGLSPDTPGPCLVCSCHKEPERCLPEPDIMDDPWLKKVYSLIKEEYMNPEFSTSQAAKRLYVSERSLQRKFKSLTGMTFTEQLFRVRLEKACERLLSGDKISDVAFDTGFNDASYFSQRFKNYYGISPSAFIESRSSGSSD